MYKNLKAELVRANITNKELSEVLGITKGTASLKINGKARITLKEAFMIQEFIYEKTGTKHTTEYLFKI